MAAGYRARYGDVVRAWRSRFRRAASTSPSASHIAPPAGLPLTPQPHAPTLPGPLLLLLDPPLPVALVATSPPLPLPLEVAVAPDPDPVAPLALPPDSPLPPAPPPPLLALLLIAPPAPLPLAPLLLLAALLAVVLPTPQTPLLHVPPGHTVPSGSAGVEHVPLCAAQVPAA